MRVAVAGTSSHAYIRFLLIEIPYHTGTLLWGHTPRMSSTPCKVTFLSCSYPFFLSQAGGDLVNKLVQLPLESNCTVHTTRLLIKYFVVSTTEIRHVAQHSIPTHAPLFLTFSSVFSRTLHFSCATTQNRLTRCTQSCTTSEKTSDWVVTCFKIGLRPPFLIRRAAGRRAQ